jgi:dihydrofolate synthase/folylpolyglutamate synthase
LPKTATYYFTKAQIPRALPAQELAAKASLYDLKGTEYPEVNIALRESLRRAQKDDLILICGSVFLIGEVDASVLT